MLLTQVSDASSSFDSDESPQTSETPGGVSLAGTGMAEAITRDSFRERLIEATELLHEREDIVAALERAIRLLDLL